MYWFDSTYIMMSWLLGFFSGSTRSDLGATYYVRRISKWSTKKLTSKVVYHIELQGKARETSRYVMLTFLSIVSVLVQIKNPCMMYNFQWNSAFLKIIFLFYDAGFSRTTPRFGVVHGRKTWLTCYMAFWIRVSIRYGTISYLYAVSLLDMLLLTNRLQNAYIDS